MQILLVTPISNTHYVVPPIGLGYLASALRKNGFNDISILDCIKENFTFKDFENFIKNENPQVIGFQVFSFDFGRVKRSIDIVRRLNPDATIIVGGAHISTTRETVLNELPKADFGVWGAGEETPPLLLKKTLKGEEI